MFGTRCFCLSVQVLLCCLLLSVHVRAQEDTKAPQGCYCVGMRGNVDCDYNDAVTVADVSFLINHLFIDGTALPNPEEANADGDPEGRISISDLGRLIDYLFISVQPLPDCY